MQRVHVFISGKVQGVTFRASTRRKADELGLTGWVRNLEDGRVEAVFEGEEEDIEAMLTFCHKGPAPAQVEDISIEEEEPQTIEGFEIRPTTSVA